ncbi:hypothetical protein glysoja_019570 [Glycine soja]|nr:hypothetical protein glysoja_019570 [Glycine soja]
MIVSASNSGFCGILFGGASSWHMVCQWRISMVRVGRFQNWCNLGRGKSRGRRRSGEIGEECDD